MTGEDHRAAVVGARTGRPGGGAPEPVGIWRAGTLGALCGLAWAAALRALMAELASVSRVDWFGTFGAVLVPGAVVGALLAIAWARGAAGATRGIGWFALAPLAFVFGTLVQPEVLEDLLSGGFGLGEIAFTAFVVAGGFGIGGRRPRWARWTCAVIGAAFLVALVASLSVVGGPRFSPTVPRGAWLAVLAGSLGTVLMVAEAIPFRYASRARDAAVPLERQVEPERPAELTE